MKKKLTSLIWRTAQGEQIALKDLKTEHLQNIAALLQRRKEAFDNFTYMVTGLTIDPIKYNDVLVTDWLKAIGKILEKRCTAEREAAAEILSRR
jgi:hypothetical protein